MGDEMSSTFDSGEAGRKRFVRIVAISLGSLLIFAVAVVFVSPLPLEYRFNHQNRQLAQSISEKLAPVVVRTPQPVWDTDLRPYGFPEDSFDSALPRLHSPRYGCNIRFLRRNNVSQKQLCRWQSTGSGCPSVHAFGSRWFPRDEHTVARTRTSRTRTGHILLHEQ